jgi:hypothetical protein
MEADYAAASIAPIASERQKAVKGMSVLTAPINRLGSKEPKGALLSEWALRLQQPQMPSKLMTRVLCPLDHAKKLLTIRLNSGVGCSPQGITMANVREAAPQR